MDTLGMPIILDRFSRVVSRDINNMRRSAKGLLVSVITAFFLNGCTQSLEEGLPDSNYYHSTGWTAEHGSAFSTNPQNCRACHGADLKGGSSGVSCVPCHHAPETPNFHHGSTVAHIVAEQCDGCHGEDFTGGHTSISCFECHTDRDSCSPCHKLLQSHPMHTVVNSKGPTPLACEVCHDENPFNYIQFADGEDLSNTAVCDNCHSPNGTYNGVTSSGDSVGAKNNWKVGVYDGTKLASGKQKWCGGCHDDQPGNTRADGTGEDAPELMGDNSTYGFYVTGHGKVSGTYARLSRQEMSADGNPAANQVCSACHDLTSAHFNNAGKRLRAGYETDQSNSTCNNCHPPGASAIADPQFYGDSAAYENSAHGIMLCIECHEVHGADGTYVAMNKADQENLCYWCHPYQGPHGPPYGEPFCFGSNTYTQECISCHNVHIVTATYPVIRFSDPTNLWGDDAGEDIATFCADCHDNLTECL